jgi:hypothetical protein
MNQCCTSIIKPLNIYNHVVFRYLRRDKDDQEALKQAKLLEEEKAQFAVSY